MSMPMACLRLLLIAISFLVWPQQGFSQTIIDEGAESVAITQELFYWIDPSNRQTLQDIQQHPEQLAPYTKPVYSQGYAKGSHWLHFNLKIRSREQMQISRLLEINFPFLWLLDVYVFDGSQLLYHGHTGSAYPASSRPFEHANFVFPLAMPTNRDLDFYIRTQNDGPVMLPITLWQQEAFTTYTGWRQTGFGIYFGIMLALGLYNFFLFLSIRTHSYLWYTAHILGICLINVSVSGFGSQYLWREFPYFGFIAAAFFSYITNYIALQFTRSFLNSRKVAPSLDKAMAYLGLFQLSYLLVFFYVPKAVSLMLFTVISLVTVTLIVTTGMVCYQRGQRTARFFLLAWSIFEVTIVIKLLSLTGIVPNTSWTHYSVILGSIFESLLLALALADQINQYKTEQAAFQKKALVASEESNRLKDEFLATISHELRTPMNGVKGALQLLKKENLPVQADSYVDLAQLSAQDMLALIDSILGFSEIQSGTLKLDLAPFNLADEIEGLSNRLTQQAQNKGLKVRVNLAIAPHQYLLGDAARILLIFHHLIDNAIKFTHFGSISIEIKQLAGHIQFKVADTGVGLDSLQSEKIFAAFSQIESAFNRRFGGLGIGLSICQRLLHLMDGELSFTSELGKGSEFSVNLQLPTVVTPQIMSDNSEKLKRFQVMVVEDNPVNMQVLTAMLKKLGVEYLAVNNGEEAIEHFRQKQFHEKTADLIFMDCQMPIVDGFEATRSIRGSTKQGESIPIIAVTANALSGDRQRCLEAGMNDYIKKPITLEIIHQSLMRWLPDYRDETSDNDY